MSIRFGGILLTPNTIMVFLAAGFFWALASRSLYPSVVASKRTLILVLFAASGMGLVFGILYARIASVTGVHDAFDLHLGSLGGYGGAVLGAIMAAGMLHLRIGEVADGIVPGIAGGGLVARIGCLFTGCCRGYGTAVAGIPLLYPWPLFDMAALALAYGTSTAAIHPGKRTATFLATYGGLRFMLELARPSAPLWGPLSVNMASALSICLLGALAFACLSRHADIGRQNQL